MIFVFQNKRISSDREDFDAFTAGVYFYVWSKNEGWSRKIRKHTFFILLNRHRFVKPKRWPNFTSPSSLLPSSSSLIFFSSSQQLCLLLQRTLFCSLRSFGWRTIWSSVQTPSSWCRTTRVCWLWTSASQACSMGADTPAEPSMILGRMKWSASWRFEVRCLHLPRPIMP